MSRVYSYIVCHVYIVISYVLYDNVCYVQVFTNNIFILFCSVYKSFSYFLYDMNLLVLQKSSEGSTVIKPTFSYMYYMYKYEQGLELSQN